MNWAVSVDDCTAAIGGPYIMKSVGATDGYVRFPFVVEGLLLGVVAGGIGYGLISLLYRALANNLTTFKLIRLHRGCKRRSGIQHINGRISRAVD